MVLVISQPGVDHIHTWVDPSEGRHIKQLLEVRHHGSQNVLIWNPQHLAE